MACRIEEFDTDDSVIFDERNGRQLPLLLKQVKDEHGKGPFRVVRTKEAIFEDPETYHPQKVCIELSPGKIETISGYWLMHVPN